MNIFFLSWDPKLCAQEHSDRHVVKMILETAQMLYTACWYIWYEYENNIQIKDRSQKATFKPDTKITPKWIKDAPKTKTNQSGYRPTHGNHPCNIWIRENLANYQWLAKLGMELCLEYSYRYEKKHLCQQHIHWLMDNPPPLFNENQEMTQPRLAMPDIYKRENQPVLSYRLYYLGEKTAIARWEHKRPAPIWYLEKNPFWPKENPLELTQKLESPNDQIDNTPKKLQFKNKKTLEFKKK